LVLVVDARLLRRLVYHVIVVLLLRVEVYAFHVGELVCRLDCALAALDEPRFVRVVIRYCLRRLVLTDWPALRCRVKRLAILRAWERRGRLHLAENHAAV